MLENIYLAFLFDQKFGFGLGMNSRIKIISLRILHCYAAVPFAKEASDVTRTYGMLIPMGF